MISESAASFLKQEREEWNARFVVARHRWPALRTENFLPVLGVAVAAALPGKSSASKPALNALYDLLLTLGGNRWFGMADRRLELAGALGQLTGAYAASVADKPKIILRQWAHALLRLAANPLAKPGAWADFLARSAEHLPDGESMRRAGLVAAWRYGLVSLRSVALQHVEQLPRRVVAGLFECPEAEVAEVVAEHRAHSFSVSTQLQVRAMAGGFAGWGGPFFRPPLVSHTKQGLLVRSGDSFWQLLADRYGVELRAAGAPARFVPGKAAVCFPDGHCQWNGTSFARGNIPVLTSAAEGDGFLVMTSTDSYWLFLVA